MLQCFVCSPIPKVSEKKWATGQSFIRKEITTYRIGTLVHMIVHKIEAFTYIWLKQETSLIAYILRPCRHSTCQNYKTKTELGRMKLKQMSSAFFCRTFILTEIPIFYSSVPNRPVCRLIWYILFFKREEVILPFSFEITKCTK